MKKYFNLFYRLFLFYFDNRLYRNFFCRRPLLVYVGAAQSANFGDLLLYKAICAAIPKLLIAPIFATSNFKGGKLLGIVKKLGTLIFCGFKKPKALLLGGGTLMNNRHFFEMLVEKRSAEMPILIFGTSIEDFGMWGNSLPVELELYRNAKKFYVRNPFDAQVLNELGVKSIVIGDPVLNLCQPKIRNSKIKNIGINLGCDKTMTHGGQEVTNRSIADFVKNLIAKGYNVEFFTMHQDQDLPDIAAVIELVGNEKLELWHAGTNWDDSLRRMEQYDLIIGQRLHAVIIASGFGIPSISLSYRPKCLHFMKSVNMEKYCLQVDSVSTEKLEELLLDIEANYKEINSKLVSVVEQYQGAIKNAGQAIQNWCNAI